jgi:hypothetical protein
VGTIATNLKTLAMDFLQAIAALKKLNVEGTDIAALVGAVEAEVSRLNDKVYTTIGESRSKSSKATTLEAAMMAIAKTLGITETELDSVLNAIEPKVKEAVDGKKTAQTKVTELETELTTAKTKVTEFESDGKWNTIASKTGADAKVLKRLLGDKLGEMTIADDGVKLGDKSLREFVEADEELKSFVPALFPADSKPDSKPNNKSPESRRVLPGGSPKGDDKSGKTDPVAAYVSKAYKGAKSLQPKS